MKYYNRPIVQDRKYSGICKSKVTKQENSKADYISDKLAETFKNYRFKRYYCKVAYLLSEKEIWDLVDEANKGNNPSKLFTYLANIKMRNKRYNQ